MSDRLPNSEPVPLWVAVSDQVGYGTIQVRMTGRLVQGEKLADGSIAFRGSEVVRVALRENLIPKVWLNEVPLRPTNKRVWGDLVFQEGHLVAVRTPTLSV